VCEILEQAVVFSEQKLVDECIEFVKKNAADVVNTDGLLGVSQPILKMIFEKWFVEFDPLKCYEVSTKWALKHLKAENIDDIDSEKVRDVLGDVLDAIQDKISLMKMTIDVERFEEIETCYWINDGGQDGISFTVSSPALLTGVKLYLPIEDGETSGLLEILEMSDIVLSQYVTLQYRHGKTYRNELLITKIPLKPDKIYSVRHQFRGKETYTSILVAQPKKDTFFYLITVVFMDLKHGSLDTGTCLV